MWTSRRVALAALTTVALLAPGAGLARADAPGAGPSPERTAPADPDQRLDRVAPRLALGGSERQRLRRRLTVYATCNEPCEFDAQARVRGADPLRNVRIVTPAKASDGGRRVKFEIRLSRRGAKLIGSALRAGRRVTLRVRVSAIDLGENETDRSLVIRVTR